VVSDDLELAKLNYDYRNIDGPTDVLTFNLTDEFTESKLNTPNLQGTNRISGDIYISSDRIIVQANERSVKPEEEFLHLLAHGLLHLCGWTHEDDVSLSKIIQTGEKYISMSYNGN
jgi:probable rRNA maturation factor